MSEVNVLFCKLIYIYKSMLSLMLAALGEKVKKIVIKRELSNEIRFILFLINSLFCERSEVHP